MPLSPKKGKKALKKRGKKLTPFEGIEIEQLSQGQSSSDTDLRNPLFNHSGNFEEDFAKLCYLHGIEMVPRVMPRPRRPCSPEEVRKASNYDRRQSSSTEMHRVKKSTIVGRSLMPSKQLSSDERQPERLTSPTERKRSTVSIPGRLTSPRERRSIVSNSERLTSPREHKMGTERHHDSSTDSSQPTTFSETDRLSFFRPCVQVKYHQSQKSQQVTEIYIRGWKVDSAMMDVLQYCCVFLAEHLAVLQLWNVGLTADTVHTLATFLPMCRHLTTLLLDTNPLGGVANLSELIDKFSPVQHLSLRFCGVTDQAALGLGSALGTVQTWNRKLLTLNLSNNRITDVGVRHLAKGLMTNRTLLVLNLDNNQIGDEGAAVLAQVLSYFALSHEQIKYRRWIFSERERMLSDSVSSSSNNYNLADVTTESKATTPAPEKKKTRADKEKDHMDKSLLKQRGGMSRSRAGSTASFSKVQEQRGHAQQPGKTVTKEQKMSPAARKKYRSQKSKSKQSEKSAGLLEANPLGWHPLAEFGSLDEEGQFRIVGNRSLLSLNLARNRIQEEGLRRLLDMLQTQASPRPHQDHHLRGHHHHYYQQQYLLQLLQHHPQPPPWCSFTGLKRLVLHQNAVATDNDVLMKIQHLLLTRDAMYNKNSAQVA